MDRTVKVLDVHEFENLWREYHRYRDELPRIIQSMERQVSAEVEWIRSRVNFWATAVQKASQEEKDAMSALMRCKASGKYDPRTGQYYEPPCIQQLDALRMARRRLREAQGFFAQAQEWNARINNAAREFRQQQTRLHMRGGDALQIGEAFLRERLHLLRDFIQTKACMTGEARSILRDSFDGESFPIVDSNDRSTIDALSLEISQGNQNTPTTSFPKTGVPIQYYYQKNEAGQKETIHYVSVADIDVSETTVQTAADFIKVSMEDVIVGFQKLVNVVMPAVISKGADSGYFSEVDSAQMLEYENGYRKIFDVFYGNDAIRLEYMDGRFNVINGYHRLYVARMLNIERVPAFVVKVNKAGGETA